MGKGGKKDAPVDTDKKIEVLIDGRLFDVTNMKHPGGSVIKFYSNNNIDATQAFDNFHLRSKKARKYMESLPNRPATDKAVKDNYMPGQEQLLKDFNEFTAQLKKEVLLNKNYLSIPFVVHFLIGRGENAIFVGICRVGLV